MKFHLIMILSACTIASSATASTTLTAEAALAVKLHKKDKVERTKSKDANLACLQRIFKDPKAKARARALSDARRQKARAKHSY